MSERNTNPLTNESSVEEIINNMDSSLDITDDPPEYPIKPGTSAEDMSSVNKSEDKNSWSKYSVSFPIYKSILTALPVLLIKVLLFCLSHIDTGLKLFL